jgi:hypothetical protein
MAGRQYVIKGRLDEGGYKPAFSIAFGTDDNIVTITDTLDPEGFQARVKLPSFDEPTDGVIDIPETHIQCDHPKFTMFPCIGRYDVDDERWYLRLDSPHEKFAAFYVDIIGYNEHSMSVSSGRSGSYVPRGRTGSSV